MLVHLLNYLVVAVFHSDCVGITFLQQPGNSKRCVILSHSTHATEDIYLKEEAGYAEPTVIFQEYRV